jgi:DNA-binding transcriptional LysR family regulator
MSISPYRLLILRTVATEGGVLAAARSLHLAPSGVSAHLASLERETGLVLVDRTVRGGQRATRLTVAGTKLAARGARLFDLLADTEAEVAALRGESGGDVTIAAFSTAIESLVAPALTVLEATHPAVSIHVLELDPAPAIIALQSGTVDIVLDEHDLDLRPTFPRELTYRHLRDDSYRVAIPRAWGEPRDLTNLASRPWVDAPEGTAVHRVLERLRRTMGLPFPGQHSCAEFPAALALVESGRAAALVPDLALTRATSDNIRVVALHQLGGRRIGVLHRPGAHGPSSSIVSSIDALISANYERSGLSSTAWRRRQKRQQAALE